MLAVVLDTNSIHRDPWLTGETAAKLVRLAEVGACAVVYPQVVIDELRRQRGEAAKQAHDLAAKGVEDMAKAGVDVAQTTHDLSDNFDRISSDLDRAFATLAQRSGVLTAPVPSVAATDLLKRDLDRRRPFMEIEHAQKTKSVGFRDVLIWETVLELLTTHPLYTPVLFVTSDKGFLAEDGKALHPDLIEDVNTLGITPTRLATVKSIPQAISEIEAHVARKSVVESAAVSEDTARLPNGEQLAQAVLELKSMRIAITRAELVEAATNALYELVNEDVSEQLVSGGDYGYPDFVDFAVPPIEGATIAAIDQTTEFSFVESPASPGVLVGTAEAVITIEGGVHRSNWFIGDDASVSIMGELNDHYLEASSEIEVSVVVELDVEGDHVDVIRVVLEDAPPPAVSTDNLLQLEIPDASELDPAAEPGEGESRG